MNKQDLWKTLLDELTSWDKQHKLTWINLFINAYLYL